MITNNQDSLNMMQNENDEGETVEVAMLSSGEETVEKSNLTMLSSVNSNAEVDADTKLGELKNDSTIRDAIMTPLFTDNSFKTAVNKQVGKIISYDIFGYDNFIELKIPIVLEQYNPITVFIQLKVTDPSKLITDVETDDNKVVFALTTNGTDHNTKSTVKYIRQDDKNKFGFYTDYNKVKSWEIYTKNGVPCMTFSFSSAVHSDYSNYAIAEKNKDVVNTYARWNDHAVMNSPTFTHLYLRKGLVARISIEDKLYDWQGDTYKNKVKELANEYYDKWYEILETSAPKMYGEIKNLLFSDTKFNDEVGRITNTAIKVSKVTSASQLAHNKIAVVSGAAGGTISVTIAPYTNGLRRCKLLITDVAEDNGVSLDLPAATYKAVGIATTTKGDNLYTFQEYDTNQWVVTKEGVSEGGSGGTSDVFFLNSDGYLVTTDDKLNDDGTVTVEGTLNDDGTYTVKV